MNRIFKMSLVGDEIFDFCVEVNETFFNNITKGKDESWDVISYRISECNKFVEQYYNIGSGWKISEDHLAVKLSETNKKLQREEIDLLAACNSRIRHAMIFLPLNSSLTKKSFSNVSKSTFDSEIIPEIQKSGLIAYPVDYGYKPLATTCTCKSFFGCTSCCTSPPCNVILGICQQNANCKSTDSTSSCNCDD